MPKISLQTHSVALNWVIAQFSSRMGQNIVKLYSKFPLWVKNLENLQEKCHFIANLYKIGQKSQL